MRNPKWHRDELILALDLYFKLEPGQIHARNSAIVDLSKLLNKLSILETKSDIERFRHPNGVRLKLSNFLAIDPGYNGKGLQAYSKLDKEIFNEFVDNMILLTSLANNIKSAINDETLLSKLFVPFDDNEDIEASAPEGKLLYRLHRYGERSRTIVQEMKKKHLKRHGTFACELCFFLNFERTYGNVGRAFIVYHHTPSELTIKTKPILEDLMLICAYCDRMVRKGWKSKEFYYLAFGTNHKLRFPVRV